MRTFLSAGEASGDAYGAALIATLRKRGETGPFEGVGGPRMAAQGQTQLADSSKWGAISIAHALPLARHGVVTYYRAKRLLASGTPGLFVPIDFGHINVRLARHARNRGWRVLFFVPPGSWRRDKQGKDLPALADRIVTPFSWSAEMLERMGADVRWFGHPIKSLVQGVGDAESRSILAVLPGSRPHELASNLPVLAEALRDWSSPLELALAPGTDVDAIRAQWPRHDDVFTVGDTLGVLRRARAAAVCSGTATLEAALLRVPMVVVYQADDKMRMEARIMIRLGLFRRPEFFSLPNILLQRGAVPEMVDQVDSVALRARLEALWADGSEREAQIAAFEELDALLGPSDAIERTAEWAMDLAGKITV